ncbi:hypothetical protein ACLKA6_007904 [Drosophila palustris]
MECPQAEAERQWTKEKGTGGQGGGEGRKRCNAKQAHACCIPIVFVWELSNIVTVGKFQRMTSGDALCLASIVNCPVVCLRIRRGEFEDAWLYVVGMEWCTPVQLHRLLQQAMLEGGEE